MLKLLLVDEVFGEDVGGHTCSVAVTQRNAGLCHSIMYPGNAHLVHTMYVPEGRRTAGGNDLGRGLVVLEQLKDDAVTQDNLPEVKRRYAYRTQAEVARHKF